MPRQPRPWYRKDRDAWFVTIDGTRHNLDALTAAVLMGHKDPSTLAKVYQHLSKNPAYLLEQAKRAAG